MERIQEHDFVKEQYKDAGKLETRISIHQKYSVNQQGFGNWIFEHYRMNDQAKILELGCGNGDMWRAHIKDIPQDAHLFLTDFSEGMLVEARAHIPQSGKVSFLQADIQSIPFQDNQFDIVIANMMLYHVPDLDKGLCEVKRVLKDDGIFYCATYGEHGITEYIQDLLSDYGSEKTFNKVFTLQNGEAILKGHFGSVEQDIYDDRLEVRDIDDLLDYIFSLTSMIQWKQLSREELYTLLQGRMKDGKIVIPKEYGMFLARK